MDCTAVEPIKEWYIATIHRDSNTDQINKLESILEGLNNLDARVLFPVHPRIKHMLEKLRIEQYSNIIFLEPMGYLEMLYFNKNAIKLITDSGGLQKEAYILETPGVTVNNHAVWIETLRGNYNVLAKTDAKDIQDKVLNTKIDTTCHKDYYGDGHAVNRLLEIMRTLA